MKKLIAAMILLMASLSAHALEPFQLSAKIAAFNKLASTCEIHGKLNYGNWMADCSRARDMLIELADDLDGVDQLNATDDRRFTNGLQSLQTIIYLKGWDK